MLLFFISNKFIIFISIYCINIVSIGIDCYPLILLSPPPLPLPLPLAKPLFYECSDLDQRVYNLLVLKVWDDVDVVLFYCSQLASSIEQHIKLLSIKDSHLDHLDHLDQQ